MRKSPPLLSQVFQRIAKRCGADVYVEPQWGFVGQITFRNGVRRYFRYSSLDLNPLGASEIAKDKGYANLFLQRMQYPVVPNSRTFFAPAWGRAIRTRRGSFSAALKHAARIGYPVIVKPNSGSQGVGVSMAHNRRELSVALREIYKQDRVAIVQQPVCGKDYRVVVLDGRVISAYQRIPLNVVGDGRSTILQLLRKKQRQFEVDGRDTLLDLKDSRIYGKLTRQGLSMRHVLRSGQIVYLLDNANLSTGGDSIDVTGKVHPGFKKQAAAITRDMGLRLCGVDLMIDGDIAEPPRRWWILEINSAPGLDHYAKSGRMQAALVDRLYAQVLKRMRHSLGARSGWRRIRKRANVILR